jgi:hypothetical protein
MIKGWSGGCGSIKWTPQEVCESKGGEACLKGWSKSQRIKKRVNDEKLRGQGLMS